jgi:type VI secretion system protein
MREDRLLERIRSLQKDPLKRKRGESATALDSIMRHLQRILNTKQGNVPIAPDFGLPDLTDLHQNHLDSLRWFERAIRQTIQKYEPRLKAIRVRFVPNEADPLSLSFQIVGKLVTEGHQDPVRFESVVGSDGRISIRR